MSETVLTPSQLNTVAAVATAFSALSLLGSAFILVCYAALPRLRRFSFTLVAALSLADVFNQLFDLIRPSTDAIVEMERGGTASPLCLAQAVGDNFFELTSVLWTSAIATLLYVSVVWRWQLQDTWRTLAAFAAPCYGVPLVLTIVPGAMGAFGPAGDACWIIDRFDYLRYVTFYAPLWLAIAFNSTVYFRVMSLLRATTKRAGRNDEATRAIQQMMKRLNVYPFILVVCWTLSSINQVVESASGRQVFGLRVVASAMASMQGLFNALAYGMSATVAQELRDLGARLCPRCIKDSATLTSEKLLHGSGGGSGRSVSGAGASTTPPSSTFAHHGHTASGLGGVEMLPTAAALAGGNGSGRLTRPQMASTGMVGVSDAEVHMEDGMPTDIHASNMGSGGDRHAGEDDVVLPIGGGSQQSGGVGWIPGRAGSTPGASPVPPGLKPQPGRFTVAPRHEGEGGMHDGGT